MPDSANPVDCRVCRLPGAEVVIVAATVFYAHRSCGVRWLEENGLPVPGYLTREPSK